jgi:MinD-like ATPase involved in chromosome partitioning or flagellar assembly
VRTISFIQYKGGVGKTTAAALLCRVLSAAGYRVLAIDLDWYQHHLSTLLGGALSPEPCECGTSNAYASGVLSHLLCKTSQDNLDYITLCGSLCDPETRDAFQLRKRFAFFNLRAHYEYVLIDTPPGFGPVHELAMHASDDIIVPTDLSPISLSAVERFCTELDKQPCPHAARCHILRHFLVATSDVDVVFHKSIKGRISAHSLSAHDRVRAVTSGNPDFIKLPLPRSIVSQLVLIAADLLNADRTRLQNALAGLCGPDEIESQKDRQTMVFNDLINVPPTVTLSTDVSIAAS